MCSGHGREQSSPSDQCSNHRTGAPQGRSAELLDGMLRCAAATVVSSPAPRISVATTGPELLKGDQQSSPTGDGDPNPSPIPPSTTVAYRPMPWRPIRKQPPSRRPTGDGDPNPSPIPPSTTVAYRPMPWRPIRKQPPPEPLSPWPPLPPWPARHRRLPALPRRCRRCWLGRRRRNRCLLGRRYRLGPPVTADCPRCLAGAAGVG